MKKYLTLIGIVAVMFSFSCQNKTEKSKILAKVGNTYITEDYMNEKIMELGDFDYLKTKIGKKQFLDILINERLIKMASENSGLKNSKEYKENIEKIEKELKKRLEEYKEVILTKMWVDKMKENELKTTDEEVNKYIKENNAAVSFDQVITTDYETAQSILSELKKGTSIDKLSQKYKNSENVVVNRIPPVIKGELMSELEEIIFKMKPGEIGGIIKTKLGYHIIKKTSQSKIDEKSPSIKERVKKILEKKKFDSYIEKLQSKYKVEVLDEELK